MKEPKFKNIGGHHKYGWVLDKLPNEKRTVAEIVRDNDEEAAYETELAASGAGWEPMSNDTE